MIIDAVFCAELNEYFKMQGHNVQARKSLIAIALKNIPVAKRDEYLEKERALADKKHIAKFCESEKSAQMRFVEWMRKTHPEIDIYMNRNDGTRTPQEKGEQIALGLMRGVPDLFIPSLFTYVEMKKEKGGVISEEQKQFARRRALDGYRTCFAFGYNEAVSFVTGCIENDIQLKLEGVNK